MHIAQQRLEMGQVAECKAAVEEAKAELAGLCREAGSALLLRCPALLQRPLVLEQPPLRLLRRRLRLGCRLCLAPPLLGLRA